jgi:thiosulfate/3-mercaptopyruvate sulfurtransferase
MVKFSGQQLLGTSVVMLVFLAFASTVYAHCYGNEAKAKGYTNASLLVSGQEINDHLGDGGVRILDVRSARSYLSGHIPGAVNLPISEINRTINGVPGMLAPIEVLEQALGKRGVTRETRVVIYDDIGGVPATRLFWALDYLSHPQTSVLQGGFEFWRREGRPTSKEVSKLKAARYEGKPRPELLADKAWVKDRLKDPSTVLVDARSTQEYDGVVPGRVGDRAGHIPGAVSVDWTRNLTGQPPQFKEGAKLARMYRKAGAAPKKEVVVYCRTGQRAAHDYFVLRLLGYPRVRLYDGSHVEWAVDSSLPVER